MTIKKISSRTFNQDASGAKKASNEGPVFITDRGQVSHVLLSIDDYKKIVGDENIVDLIAMVEGNFDFEPAKLDGKLVKPAVFE